MIHSLRRYLPLFALVLSGCATAVWRVAESATKREDWPLAAAAWSNAESENIYPHTEEVEKRYLIAKENYVNAYGHWIDEQIPVLQKLVEEGKTVEAYGRVTSFASIVGSIAYENYRWKLQPKIVAIYDLVVLAMIKDIPEEPPLEQRLSALEKMHSLVVYPPKGSLARDRLLRLEELVIKPFEQQLRDEKTPERRVVLGRIIKMYGGNPYIEKEEDQLRSHFVIRGSSGCDEVERALYEVFPQEQKVGQPLYVDLVGVKCETTTTTLRTAQEPKSWYADEDVAVGEKSHRVCRNVGLNEHCTNVTTQLGWETHSIGHEEMVSVEHYKWSSQITGEVVFGGQRLPLNVNHVEFRQKWFIHGRNHDDIERGKSATDQSNLVDAFKKARDRILTLRSLIQYQDALGAKLDGKADETEIQYVRYAMMGGRVSDEMQKWFAARYGIPENEVSCVLGVSTTHEGDCISKESPLAFKLEFPKSEELEKAIEADERRER